ncbi:TetR/AcrR family transcriptional regulator [Tsukamurella soli]
MAMTRAQSQARTRALLVSEATRLFLERGFAATSLDAIGEAAGFTRGAVYSNFASKTEIGLAVLDGLYASVAQSAGEAAARVADQGPARWIEVVAQSMESSIGAPRWARLEVEVAASCTDEQVRESFGRRYAEMRASWQRGFLAVHDPQGSLTADPEQIALLLVSALLGAGLQRAADPSIPFDRVVGAIRLVADALAPAGRADRRSASGPQP